MHAVMVHSPNTLFNLFTNWTICSLTIFTCLTFSHVLFFNGPMRSCLLILLNSDGGKGHSNQNYIV